jgi:hypothetical protein
MKNFILLFLLALALTTSFFAQAGEQTSLVNVPIGRIQFDEESRTLVIQGVLPSACAVTPHPVLVASDNKQELILKVAAYEPSGVCMTVLGGKYELAFDISALKSNIAEIGLNPDAFYTIRATKYFSIDVDFSKLAVQQPFASEALREVQLRFDEKNQLVTFNDGNVLTLSSPFIAAEKFIGQSVDVQGHVIHSKTTGFDFSEPRVQSKPIFIVTGISVAPL